MTRKPVEESIGRRDDQAIVRPGAVLAIRFAHKFAGVIGFQILHHGNSAGSFDVLLGNTAQFPPYGLNIASSTKSAIGATAVTMLNSEISPISIATSIF